MPNLVASDLEIIVHDWLSRKGIIFEFQSQLIGGFNRELGDAIADFLLIESNIVLRVQGEYFHSSINERARDDIQKIRLQGLGYIVIDLWSVQILNNLNYVMDQALKGIEMSPQGQAKPITYMRGSKTGGGGTIPIPGRTMGPKTTKGDLISVRTDNPSGITPGSATLNGNLRHDGGMNCRCRFAYDEAKTDASLLCYLFPWKFYSLLNLLSPNISLDFAGTPATHSHNTVWQDGKRADDAFSQALTGLTPATYYSYKAQAKNDIAESEGQSIIFSQ